MNAGKFLDDPKHARVFAETVVPESRFNQSSSRAHPRAVFTAGQPGAGKSGVVAGARIELSGNVVVIDPDELRNFVPGIKRLQEQHPLNWSGESHPAAKAYADGLRDLSIAGRRNIIIDTTLAGADPVIEQIRTMQAKGYEVEVRVVAAHRLESELGIDKRYARSLVEDGSGRHVPGDFHDYAYRNLPGNLDKVHEQTGARIRIYNREGVELYDSRTSPLKPGVALAQAREARLHDPKVTRTTAEVGREQQDFHRKLPETLERNPGISRETAKNLPPERAALDVVTRIEHAAGEASAVDFGTRIKPAVHTGLKVAAGAAGGLDTVLTGRETARLLDQDNLTGAQSQILHFGARNLGMAGGAALGSSAGVTLGAPGMVIGGIAGGVGGAVAGEKMADAVDRARIYSQRGSDGHLWQSDHQHPERGWSRHAPAYGTDAQGKASYEMQTLQAGPRLASELDYKASSTAVELALAQAPDPKNPFSQPAGPNDAHAVDATPWTRDPATRQWSRYVADPVQAAMGNPTGNTEQASLQRSAELDRAAQATIARNIEHSRQGIAQRYQDAYEQHGWKQHGPVPAAVLDAERSPPTQQQAPAARANPAPTQRGMSFAEAHQRRDEPEKISPGSLQTVGSLAKPDRQHELTLLREIGIVNTRTRQEMAAPQVAVQRAPAHRRTPSVAVPSPAPGGFDPRHTDHPHHRDFQKIYTTVAQTGRWDAEQSTNIASQVLADFRAAPMGKRVDVVAVEPDLQGRPRVFAGHAPWGENKGFMGKASVDAAEAARVPAERGFERLEQFDQQQQLQEQEQHQEQQRARQQTIAAPRR